MGKLYSKISKEEYKDKYILCDKCGISHVYSNSLRYCAYCNRCRDFYSLGPFMLETIVHCRLCNSCHSDQMKRCHKCHKCINRQYRHCSKCNSCHSKITHCRKCEKCHEKKNDTFYCELCKTCVERNYKHNINHPKAKIIANPIKC